MRELLFLLPVAFAIQSRAVGKGVDGARVPGGVVLAGLGFFLGGFPGLAMALGAAITRVMDFKTGAATPTTPHQFVSAAFRLFPFAIGAALATLLGKDHALLALPAYAIVHLAFAGWYGRKNAEAVAAGKAIGNQATIVELGQGAAAGAAIAMALSF